MNTVNNNHSYIRSAFLLSKMLHVSA